MTLQRERCWTKKERQVPGGQLLPQEARKGSAHKDKHLTVI